MDAETLAARLAEIQDADGRASDDHMIVTGERMDADIRRQKSWDARRGLAEDLVADAGTPGGKMPAPTLSAGCSTGSTGTACGTRDGPAAALPSPWRW